MDGSFCPIEAHFSKAIHADICEKVYSFYSQMSKKKNERSLNSSKNN